MVPADEVQKPVCQEHRQLGSQVDAAFAGLTGRGRNAQHEIAEQGSRAVAEATLTLRESEYVGRPILLAIGSVQQLDLVVARQ